VTGDAHIRQPTVEPSTALPDRAERLQVVVTAGRQVSALRWGNEDAEVVLLHGGAQNAHTWDAVASAFGRRALCIDLPGHGHSDRRDDRDYRPRSLAVDIADVIAELAPQAQVVAGMSLGA
jgi:pimeloyl-ACP methyl ester carboxylesterase